MRRAVALVRATPVAVLLTVVPGSLALTSAPAEASASVDEPAASESSGPGWGPILGACFGVLFGGALALWQIRGMKNRR